MLFTVIHGYFSVKPGEDLVELLRARVRSTRPTSPGSRARATRSLPVSIADGVVVAATRRARGRHERERRHRHQPSLHRAPPSSGTGATAPDPARPFTDPTIVARLRGSCGHLPSFEQVVLRGLQRHRHRAVQRGFLSQRRDLDPRPERGQLAELAARRARAGDRRSSRSRRPGSRAPGSTTDATAAIASAIRCASPAHDPARLGDRRRRASSNTFFAVSGGGIPSRRASATTAGALAAASSAPATAARRDRADRSRPAGGSRPRRRRRALPR